MSCKKIVLVVVFILLATCIIYAQVNFQYEFSIDKLDNNDVLCRSYLFDYNNDGIDDYAVDYAYEYWGIHKKYSLAIYNNNGTLIDNLTNDWMERCYMFENCGIQNRKLFIKTIDDSLFVSLKEYSSGNTLDSMRVTHTTGHFFAHISDINSHIQNDTTYIFIGAYKKWAYIGAWYYRSYLFIFKIIDDELFYLGDIENCGFNGIISNSSLLSVGLYFEINDNGAWGAEDFDFYLKTVSIEDTIAVYPLHFVGGSKIYSTPIEWIHYPVNYTILTKNPQSDYPHLLQYQQYDSDDGDSLFFNAYDLTTNQEVWSVSDTISVREEITSSTCISVNGEDHYVMYFRGDKLEIRDRISGNIVHHQVSVLAVCEILRKSDGELLFFVEKQDETGYDVYTLDGPIFVSADEPPAQNEFMLQNSPNPFRTSTTIQFNLTHPTSPPVGGSVVVGELSQIKIYNVKGQLVREFLLVTPSHSHPVSVTWDGKDKNGQKVATGVYLYQLCIDGEYKAERKCLLIE